MSLPNNNDDHGHSFASDPDLSYDSDAIKISTEVMVAAVVLLFLVVLFVFFLYLYARRFFTSPSLSVPRRRRRSRHHFVLAADLAPRRGLDAALLAALPIAVYTADDPKFAENDGLECAVCLSDVADGEEVRRLPKCGHGFHVECIDMWFHSHSTCPLCRSSVAGEEAPPPAVAPVEAVPESPTANFPTNVLFWGTHDSVSSRDLQSPPAVSGDGAPAGPRGEGLVIEIPSRRVVVDGFQAGEEAKSPVSARFRSLRRLWSRGNSGAAGCSSPRDGGDVEQGFGGFCGESSSRTPKTPKTPRTPSKMMNL